jgi:hypothetical protein
MRVHDFAHRKLVGFIEQRQILFRDSGTCVVRPVDCRARYRASWRHRDYENINIFFRSDSATAEGVLRNTNQYLRKF